MLITIAGIGVLLRSVRKRAIFLLYELNSLLRTILYAGKTELAVTGRLHSSRRQLIVAARTNVGTNATVNTNIGHGKELLAFHQEAHLGVESTPLHKTLVLLPFLLRHRFVPMLPTVDICRYLLQVLGDVLVKNVLNGAKQAAGKWVFTVSPGDYLYDADTVAWLLEVLRRDAPRVAFGRLACYADRNGAPIQRPGDAPFDRTPYRPGAYDAKTAKRNMLLYDDGISGAGLVYERELLVQALEKMAGRVLLAEDFAARLFAVENIPIVGYDRCIAWYEVGTGVSTNEGAHARMLRDWRAMVELLRELYPKDRTVRLAYEYYFNDRHKSRLVRGRVGRLIVPQNAPFKKAQHAWVPPVNGDIQELKQIYESALGHLPS